MTSTDFFNKPIFVLGLPRSGTSMIAGALGICGAWLGRTVPGGGPENPRGFFEHTVLRERVNKQILENLGCDPLGVRKLPGLKQIPDLPDFHGTIREVLENDQYTGTQPWLFKDAKLSLLWPLYLRTFPLSRWIIVRRDSNEIVNSCINTSFMAQHSTDPDSWYPWIDQYLLRLDRLKQTTNRWHEIWPGKLVSGDMQPLQGLVEDLQLNWNPDEISRFINKDYWHG